MPALRVQAPTISLRYPYNEKIRTAMQAAMGPSKSLIKSRLTEGKTPVPLGKDEVRHPKSRRAGPLHRAGTLRRSLQIIYSPDGKSMELSWGAPYASYVESGTPPHDIKPVLAQALAFRWRGKWVVTKSVRHPGTMAQPFARPSADIARKIYIKLFREILKGYGIDTVHPRFGRGHWSALHVTSKGREIEYVS